jgi:hypothetical protein
MTKVIVLHEISHITTIQKVLDDEVEVDDDEVVDDEVVDDEAVVQIQVKKVE